MLACAETVFIQVRSSRASRLKTLLLNPHTRNSEAVVHHVHAHAILMGSSGSRLPLAMDRHHDWPRKQEAARKPVRFIFLTPIMRPQQKLHVFGDVDPCRCVG